MENDTIKLPAFIIRIFRAIDGYKTYLLGIALLIQGIVQLAATDGAEGMGYIYSAIAAFTGREAVRKVEKKTAEQTAAARALNESLKQQQPATQPSDVPAGTVTPS